MNSLVTICVTTYNRKKLLPITIKSILQQSYSNFELIIVDDFSTDGTKEFVKNNILPLDNRIKYIRHNQNKGLASARNTAIFNAQGKYFTFIDDDDTWKKEFISNFIDIAHCYNEKYVFCTSIISFNKSIKMLSASMRDFLILGYTPPVGSQFYLTKSLRTIGGYDTNITSGIDHDLWITLGKENYHLIWLNHAMVQVNPIASNQRITYNIDKRITGIQNSLSIWRNRVGNSFGKDFFQCLEKNYQYNTYKKFILLSLKDKKNNNLLYYFKCLPKKLFLLDLKRYLFNKNRLLKHPTFIPCNNLQNKTSSELMEIKNDTTSI